ncbi:hypothetical protein GCM10012279_48990 [Micromonospora yangpuensis]|uniref:Conserved TM helix n=1 Tax=Micromonospora yangpuensis TaxID=683228 RepID=A0A1C6UTM5_9ACTN|nr:hypothetical protein [Micromonospora yangpuensis]GGM24752.1 hypothetical protein GCM10012279_48990 [Micromonospora yangpuensis]SCL57350.1 Conserved TM helix [Micromonospora yangpuensis]
MSDNVGDAVGDAFRAVLLFLPKALAFVAILVAGWLVAKAVLKIVDKVLERVGFDRAVERGGIRTALARSRYDASDIVAKLAYYGVLLLTLYLAFGIWGPNPISDLIAGIIGWLPRAFVAIVIIVVAAAIANAVKDIISSALGGLSYGRMLANVASWFILGLGVIAALNQIGIATTVTTPVLIAVLATVGGILVVGVGGGLVRPMQYRWEGWLSRAEQESRTIVSHARAYQARRDEEAAQARRDEEAAQVRRDEEAAQARRDEEAAQVRRDEEAAQARRDEEAARAAAAGPAAPGDFDPDATGVIPQDDPEATGVIRRDDPEATTVIPRPDLAATTIMRRDDPDATGVIPQDDPEATGVIRRDDPEATTVIPRDDPEATGVIRRDDPEATGVLPRGDVDATRFIPRQGGGTDGESTRRPDGADEQR